MNDRERALDHKCPGCGGKLVFSPEIGKWKCEYCKSEFDLETLQKHKNASSEENNESNEKEVDTNYVEYHCKDCGAKIIADDQTAATFCVYCGNTAILKSKLSGKFAPSKLIPFMKSKDDAINAFKGLSKGRPLMPKFFNDVNNIEKVRGIYIPFWLFSYSSFGEVEATAQRITTWAAGDYMYTKTDTYNVSRKATMKYDRIPVDGSTRFDDDIMNTIEPFDYSKLVDYNHAYLSGFLAEKYDVDDETAKKDALSRAEKTTKDTIMGSINYTTKIVKSENYVNKLKTTEYVLLPVWMVNVKYRDKMYTFAMNAQSGEFVGNIPVDVKKAIIIGSILFVGIAILVIVVSYLAYLGGA